MDSLIQTHRAPANAVAPRSIVLKELFSLDVDDSIWDDMGLADRCDEEMLRLKHEQASLKEWLIKMSTSPGPG